MGGVGSGSWWKQKEAVYAPSNGFKIDLERGKDATRLDTRNRWKNAKQQRNSSDSKFDVLWRIKLLCGETVTDEGQWQGWVISDAGSRQRKSHAGIRAS